MKIVSDLSMAEILLIQRISNSVLNEKLRAGGYKIHLETSADHSLLALKANRHDVVILSMIDRTDLDQLPGLIHYKDSRPVVVLVADKDEDLGIKAVEGGASDYMLESESRSIRLVNRIIQHAREKHAHAETQKDHKRILDLVQTVVKVGTWRWHPATDAFIPSPTFLKVFEISGTDGSYSLSSFLKLVHAEDRTLVKKTFEALQLKPGSLYLEFRIHTSAGEIRDILMKGKPAEADDGLYYHGTGQDVTELNENSENILQKDRFLELSGEVASIGGWEFDLRTKELYWTTASYDIHEKPDDFTPSFEKLLELYPPVYQVEMRNSFYRALEAHKDIFMEAPIQIGNRTKWVQYIGKLVFENGQPIKVNGIVYDITDNKLQLQKLELRAMMLDNVLEAAMAYDRQGRIVFWNKSAENLFGYTAKEAYGKTMAELGLTDMEFEDRSKIFESLKAGKSVAGEYITRDKSGREFPIWGSLSPVRETEGQAEAVLCLARDISEEKQYLRDLEDSEMRIRRLFEFSPVGKGLIDLNTYKWIDANNTLIKLLGYSRAKLLNSTMQDITPPEFTKLDLFHIKKLNRHGVFGPYQKEYLKSDGTRLKVIITGFIMNQDIGRKAWVHVLDITALDQTTESLRKSEERFRDYVENATDIILTIDDKGRIDYISPNIEKAMAYSERELTGSHFLQFIHPEDKRNTLTAVEKALNGANNDFSIISRIRHKNGNYLYVQSEGKFKVDPNGDKYGIVIARNIDQAHRSEIHVRNQNEILKEIAYIQSHVLRRPLANILGLVTLNDLNEAATSESVKLFNLIQKEAVIMDEVVADIVNKSSHISNLSNHE